MSTQQASVAGAVWMLSATRMLSPSVVLVVVLVVDICIIIIIYYLFVGKTVRRLAATYDMCPNISIQLYLKHYVETIAPD